jgi:hypothetical protein
MKLSLKLTIFIIKIIKKIIDLTLIGFFYCVEIK